jgi:glucosamine 6-phosphate synthetase-like amidotransferase/phosphosugar isomerase protein
MCGICGVHRFGDAPISKDTIDLLILGNQARGLEATGVALQQANGEVVIYKDNVTAYEFLASKDYEDFMAENLRADTVTVLGHTRKATKGTPRVIGNNHPMYAGTTAVVHNGQIHNDDWAFKDWNLDRKAETDSDIIRAVFDKHGFSHKAVNQLARLEGSAAFAAISPEFPGKLLLGRSGNPIELAATQDHLIFSSERGPLYKAMRPFKQVYGITMREMTPINYYMIGMTDHSAWLFGEQPEEQVRDWAANWLEWTQEMKIARSFTPATYTCHAQFHGNRVKFYDDRPVDVVQCPKCGIYLSVSQVHLADLKKYKCGRCKSMLR